MIDFGPGCVSCDPANPADSAMGRRKTEYSEDLRLKILELHASKLSNRAIARKLCLSSNGVSKFIQNAQNRHSIKDSPRLGRPRRISSRQLANIELGLKLGRMNDSADIQKDLLDNDHVKISRQCILDSLKRDNYKVFPLAKKPYLNRKQRKARLEHAHEWRHFTQEQWHSIVFSDETAFNRLSTGNKKYVILPVGYPFNERRTQPTASHGGGSINVWAAITNRGVLAWAVFDGGLDAAKYIKIIKTNLLKSANEYFDDEPWIFQQDNDSAHTATKTIEWLEEVGESRGFHLLPWPSHSPDLNPIENLWAHVKDLLSKEPHITNRDELEIRVGKILDDMNTHHVNYFEKLYESLPLRVKRVIANKGGPTRY